MNLTNLTNLMSLCDLTVTQALEGLRKKQFSSRELVQSCLNRIDQVEEKVNAFITITAELALEQADKADKLYEEGAIRSLLGIPVGIKDVFCTQGIETTAGSNILKGFVPPYDATVVKKLKDAGAVIMGKLNQDAFAHGSSGENSDFGITCNPWNLERVPGGSSSGSGAAVAAGECLLATGTDTGSSIRLPASFCNLVGMKNTYGRVSRYGVIAMGSSLDCPGVITKTVEDQALALKVIAGQDPLDSTSLPHRVPNYCELINDDTNIRLKVGVPQEFFVDGMDKEVEYKTQKAIEVLTNLGHQIIDISLPHTKYGVATYAILCHSEVSSNLARYDGVRFWSSARGGKDFWGTYYDTRGQGFGDEAKRRIMLGTYSLSAGYYEAYYDKAQRLRTLIKSDFDKAFEQADLILAPCSPTPPFKLGEKVNDPLQMYLSDIFVVTMNLAGIPSLSLPAGFVDDLPVGIQLIGPQLSEDRLLRAGYAYQQATGWYTKKPKLLV